MDCGGWCDCRVLGANRLVLLLCEPKGCEEREEDGTEKCVCGWRSADKGSKGGEEGRKAEGLAGEGERIEILSLLK